MTAGVLLAALAALANGEKIVTGFVVVISIVPVVLNL